MKKYLDYSVPSLGALLGVIVFLAIYGYKIVDPLFIDWVMHEDPAQNFLGWHFFRSEPWSFPIGAIHTYQYPLGTNVIYTDSIPLLAIPLKLFSFVLPRYFQYQGFWIVLSYGLMGYFAALLIRRITGKTILILTSTLFFILSPVLVQRSWGHEVLTAHWPILAALYLYFQSESVKLKIFWSLLLFATSLIHYYLFVMVFFLFAAYLAKSIWVSGRKAILPWMKYLILILTIMLFTMWVVGYFDIGLKNSAAGGFGYYSMNLLSPVMSNGYSLFFKPLPMATKGQYEGFNYFGAGLLFLIVIAVYLVIKNKIRLINSSWLPLSLVSVVLFLWALSNKITLYDKLLFEIPFPHVLLQIFNIIQASGRMFWPVTYILTMAAIIAVIKYINPRFAVLILMFAAGLQIVDFFPKFRSIQYANIRWQTPLVSPLWERLIQEVEHIVFIPAEKTKDDYIPFAIFAADHGKTINVASFARTNYREKEKYQAKVLERFKTRDLSLNTLYLIKEAKLFPLDLSTDFTWGNLDGYPIIGPGVEMKGMTLHKAPLHWPVSVFKPPEE